MINQPLDNVIVARIACMETFGGSYATFRGIVQDDWCYFCFKQTRQYAVYNGDLMIGWYCYDCHIAVINTVELMVYSEPLGWREHAPTRDKIAHLNAACEANIGKPWLWRGGARITTEQYCAKLTDNLSFYAALEREENPFQRGLMLSRHRIAAQRTRDMLTA